MNSYTLSLTVSVLVFGILAYTTGRHDIRGHKIDYRLTLAGAVVLFLFILYMISRPHGLLHSSLAPMGG
jgi:hypothetical protein